MKLLLYSEENSPRLKYVCQQVFTNWLGFSIEWTNNLSQYKNFAGIKINYSNSPILPNDFLLAKSTFLLETRTINQTFPPIVYNKIPALFPTVVSASIFPFDILATIFFHLSRYEEYLPHQADQHGRFPASESWVYQNNCLQKPVVNLLIECLKKELQKRFPTISFKKQSFQFLPTYDVDMAWAFRHKGWLRNISGYFNDLLKGQWVSLKNRIKTHLYLQNDPFQTFDWLANLDRKFSLQPIYFFLLADYGPYDKNNAITNTNFQQLVHQISNLNKIGIHPSYQSTNSRTIIRREHKRLAKFSQQSIHRSRQHYLKLHLPTTYRQLLQIGITEDYSMGYAMDIGFRAGTALPFYWYDLEKEVATDLMIYPFQVMDVTLKDYLKLTPMEAKNKVAALLATTKEVNGMFCSLWHNSSFSELEGWNEWSSVYVELLESV